MTKLFIAVYLFGLAAIMVITWIETGKVPTTHGRSILLPFGFIVGLLWPIGLAWAIVVAIALVVERLRTGSWVWAK